MKIQVMGATVEVMHGDITEMKVDAIINPANNLLWMGGGISAAIKARGGEFIEGEAAKQGPVEVGQVVLTSAGNLPARHVIHAVIAGQDLKVTEVSLRTAVHNSLGQAAKKGISSIGIPSFDWGKGSLPLHVCAQAILEEVVNFLQDSQAIRRIVIVPRDQAAHDIYKEHLEKMFSR